MIEYKELLERIAELITLADATDERVMELSEYIQNEIESLQYGDDLSQFYNPAIELYERSEVQPGKNLLSLLTKLWNR